MPRSRRALNDHTPVEFTATVDEKGNLYSLVIQCETALSEEEYALCLISFAEDILEARFSFECEDATEIISQ